ncbi:MAG: alginate lyase family protein [Streptosporangiales bacterium]|nr:alginate lyase family protein [Streptosporangiales bacterium]
MSPALGWYARRLARTSPREVVWRLQDQLRRATWVTRQVRPGQVHESSAASSSARRFTAVLPDDAAATVPADAQKALVAAADEILAGRFDVLGVRRTDLGAPDWFLDQTTGRRSEPGRYAFRVDHRDERATGNVKQVWELSRHHHLTVLAAAWYLTKDDAYAERIARHLRSWWRENPFLSGIHWTNGIEAGIRLISWVWVRRLLDGWPPVADLFERNDLALAQIRWHQQYLAAFRSRGSSANNHVVAEAAGQLVASCAFPWFPESRRWRAKAATLLDRELAANTFPDGLDRELASDYHRFVAELGLLAALEADVARRPLSAEAWQTITRMLDAAAAVLDGTGRPPRQGDGDEGRALVLDQDEHEGWTRLLALGGELVGGCGWWPASRPGVTSTLAGALRRTRRDLRGRPTTRPSHFPDAGLTLLRTVDGVRPEVWCRLDGGPHGFLSIAAHAHADALSVELRIGGVDVLADPGTYCYHGEREWRRYFRSTLGHNTIELAGRDQSVEGGPFLWLRHARTRVLGAAVDDDADVVAWSAEHDGYASLPSPARHRRTVSLDRGDRTLRIDDEVRGEGVHGVRVAYHLGPDVDVELTGPVARLSWPAAGATAQATVDLPSALRWTLHRGETDPVLGWYSPGLGRRVPAYTLLGTGESGTAARYRTVVHC